jgi:hypothetical protein
VQFGVDVLNQKALFADRTKLNFEVDRHASERSRE